ncbi:MULTISPECIES: TOMM precursor leader peptide-binding protein [unclassified Streptomyces]|uniref:TOMM precursor leader peptide-binding protein n=1 Tax=unclassified Streptomyces TaxID=2593676 RepID=UPI001BECE366|nr:MULTISPECIES: TOMM precursor leader peptide-binding protein [unclassified Streptomyces]MBT2408671.1 TOMM precursor leader peptide-binding protein [Streptomyces sp. ISL-21]MBT2608645.1 TOMM precursor leader peptide-binding protein [Streptomyces sp. ISL-87]
MTETLDGGVPAASTSPAQGAPQQAQGRLVRNPYLTMVQCTDDEVLLRHGARSRYSRVLRDDGRHRVLGPLLQRFAVPQRPEEVLDTFTDRADQDELGALIDQLKDDGVLVPEDSSTFAVYRSIIGGRPVRPLAETSVAVMGLGTIGTQLTSQLTELGVGEIPALPAGDVDDERLADLLDGSDLLVLALDGFRPSLLHRVNRAAVAEGRPWLPVYADGSELIIGPLVVPGESPCYNEHEIQHESSRALRSEYQLYSEELAKHTADDIPPLLAPYAALGASWAAIGITPFLVDGASFLVGRAIRVDFERLEITQEHVLRLPRCPVCTEQRPSFRHPFL